jgi:DNA-binding CsgD family transcriptional regulator
MHRIFQSFTDHLSRASHANDLHEAMAEAAAALDLSSFAYLVVPRRPKNPPRLISNYPPTWTNHYLQQHYERFDPVIKQALGHPEPFRWGLGTGVTRRSKLQQRLFDEAANFGIRHGFTVPIHDDWGAVAAVTFASDGRRPQFERCINEHARVLQLMAIYFHAHAKRKIQTERAIEGVSLSSREFECLEWAALGKTAWETGQILGISRRTAAFHLDNAKAKLGVNSICHAVARLIASSSNMY